MIDYKQIVEDLDVEDVKHLLYELGADEVEDKDNCLITNTLCHNASAAEASKKLYFYKDTKLFVCYTGCGNMSIFNFLKHYYEAREIEYDWYKDILQVVLNCTINKNTPRRTTNSYKAKREEYDLKKERKELPNYPNGVMDVFVKFYPPEWLKDGISKKAMDKFNIRYSISQEKIIIPHYDVNNKLVGIRGRALNEWEIENLGKYMPVQIEQTWYTHPLSLNLYGLNVNKDNIKNTGICFLFEAEKSVMQMESFDFPNCAAAVCGSHLNKYQIDLLIRTAHPREIVICFDNEEKPGEEEYFFKLWNMCKKYDHYANFSFIYDREGLSKLKDSPTDNGEEVFQQLLKRRVIVK